MIVVITGRMGSGKSSALRELAKQGMKTILPLTTRPKREGEIDGEEYRFVTEEEFQARIKNHEFVEWKKYDTAFGPWYYGTLMEDYCDYPDNLAVVLTPEGLRRASEAIAADFVSFYIYVDKEELRRRAIGRGDNPEEVERRLRSDDRDFRGFKANHMVFGSPRDIARKIRKTIYELEMHNL